MKNCVSCNHFKWIKKENTIEPACFCFNEHGDSLRRVILNAAEDCDSYTEKVIEEETQEPKFQKKYEKPYYKKA